MSIRELGRRLEAWDDRIEGRLDSLGWWGFPLSVVYGVAKFLLVLPFVGLMLLAMNLFILIWVGIPVGAVFLVAYYLAGFSAEDSFLLAWPGLLATLAILGVAQWALRKGRNPAD